MDTANPKWEECEGDLYTAVQSQIWGSLENWHRVYTVTCGPFQRRESAWRHGMVNLGHDDFNIAVTRGGRLVAMLWNDELVDSDMEVLADVTRQTGIGGHPMTADPCAHDVRWLAPRGGDDPRCIRCNLEAVQVVIEQADIIATLRARAEQAERERDEAVVQANLRRLDEHARLTGDFTSAFMANR